LFMICTCLLIYNVYKIMGFKQGLTYLILTHNVVFKCLKKRGIFIVHGTAL
jgi:hypothetical protein